MEGKKRTAVFHAFLAAVFYALNAPFSRILLNEVDPAMMAGFLYLGAGVGIGILSLFHKDKGEKLSKEDLPYVIGMVVLDIAAPILLMLGLRVTNASTVSLLNNFEITATTVIALLLFHEKVSERLWIGIFCITVSGILLSVEEGASFSFSPGALLVLGAAACWGLENNCTRSISNKSTYQIVFIKGIFSGLGSILVGLLSRESFPAVNYILPAMVLGFTAYGLSIFFYIQAQSVIGAAKTSAYYACAPFIGSFLSFVILKESFSAHYFAALIIMILGTVFVVMDTLYIHHSHMHTHTFTHTHDGSTHTHTITHSHPHDHYVFTKYHVHTHL